MLVVVLVVVDVWFLVSGWGDERTRSKEEEDFAEVRLVRVVLVVCGAKAVT